MPISQTGQVVAVYIASEAGAPMQAVEAARAVPGRGLEGDRYYRGEGSFSRWPGPRRDVTLIAEEALEAMRTETGIDLHPSETRRNILTRGVSLNDLVKVEFEVGPVRLRGVRLCQPCKRLVRLTGKPDALVKGLVNRGGLRAEILAEGVVRVGDPVRAERLSSPPSLPS